MQNFAKSFVTKRDSLRMCSFFPAGSDEPLFPSDIFSSGSAEPAGHEPILFYLNSLNYRATSKTYGRLCRLSTTSISSPLVSKQVGLLVALLGYFEGILTELLLTSWESLSRCCWGCGSFSAFIWCRIEKYSALLCFRARHSCFREFLYIYNVY